MLNETNHFVLSDKAYDFAKKLVQVLLPAVSSLYFGLAAIWGLPAAEQVVGTLAVVATFLGLVLGISARNYDASDAAYDGSIVVSQAEEGPKMFSLEIDGDPNEIECMESIRFKVQSSTEPPSSEV